MLPTILWETGLEQSPFIWSAGVSVVIMPYKCAVCQEINREQAVLVAAGWTESADGIMACHICRDH